MSLTRGVSWTLVGNLAYGASQFASLVAFAKLATANALGEFALGSAICSPILAFTSLQLRGLQATDAQDEYTIADYVWLRTVTSAAAVLVAAGIAVWTGYAAVPLAIVVLTALYKAVDSISDVLYGKLQQVNRFETISKSLLIKSVLSLICVAGALRIWGTALAAVLGLLVTSLLCLLLYDVRRTPGITLSVASDLFSRPTIHRVLKGRALVILALPMGFVLLLSSLQLNVPRYFIEHKLGTDQLGAFTALAYLVVVGSTLITAVSQTISPQFATSLADGDRLRATQLLWRLLGISALIGSASVVAAAVGGYTVLALLYTPAIARNTDAFVLIMLAGAVAYVLGALGSALTAMRILRPQLWIQMASVGSSVVVSPFLIGRYGLAGAGAVMLITNVVAVVPFAVLVARHLRTIRPVRQSAEGLDLPSPTGIVGGGSSSIAKQRRPHVVVLLRKLDVGGAERQILTFAKACAGSDTRLTLVSFYDGGELVETDQQRQGIHLVTLGKRRRWDLLRFTAAAIRTIRALRPDVIYGYQAVANELSLVIGRLLGAKVVWGLRASNMDLATYGWMTRATFRLGAFLSRFADLIVVNSYCGAQYFGSAGYAAKRMIVIPNGIDTDMFRPDVAAGAALRRAWNILPRTRLVGVVARLDPMKDHDTFLEAAAFVVQRHPDVRFVCVGDGPTAYRQSLRQRCTDLGLDRFVIWAGTERRIAAVMSAIDVLCSSSAFGEGFSNVIGEAMACETPCVVTDVGDAARIVGATGVVVPPGSPQAMSDALLSVLTLEPETLRAMGMRARRRVEEHFSVGKLVVDTCSALDSVA